MTQTKTNPENLGVQSTTKQPATVKLYNSDGVWTGYLRTLHESVAIGADNKPRIIPTGTILSPSTSSGMDGTLNVCVCRPRVHGEHSDIRYRATAKSGR